MRRKPDWPVVAMAALLLAACSPAATGESTPTVGASITSVALERSATALDDPPTVVPALGATPHLVDPGSWCMRNIVFGDPAESLYVLPYPPGQRYRLDQSYCNAQGTHKNQIAYDFDLPMGTDVMAARSGVVIDLNERTADGPFGTANYVIIRHDDATYALYGHLQFHGVDVEVGEHVATGQRIGSSGASGCAFGPHLHFAVGREPPTAERADIAVNFSNADGQLDLLGGPLEGVTYLALEPGTPVDHVERVPIGDYSGALLDGLQLPGAVLWAFDFTGASIQGADLSRADLEWALVTGADLSHADLSGANLQNADLSGAVLREINLSGADLTNAVLAGADLRSAVLRNAYLAATDLRGADLGNADLGGALLIGVEWGDSTRWPDGYEPPPRP